ncbi:LPP20 family lipoprotein [Xanthovirga aplysinae]|uniref:LPP20 family lipoprotein n=1 Tax=Xanthovirga aplysinae TaxID=2529853 RepID=UPI0012BD5AAA|nr:LPP20 family lipoprotein [Xanthovirga aplysinae]MTI30449.1 hypothetical protein [Xanthovirga aplysinae]
MKENIKKVGWVFLLCLLIGLDSCKSQQSVQIQEKPIAEEEKRPEWLVKRPIDIRYYVGIGASMKKKYPTNFADIARKHALHDLVSQIKVKISSESVFYQLDRGNNFKDEYLSNIQTSTIEELEDYELIGQWENEEEYWVYFRLSKQKYTERAALKRKQAESIALDFYKEAEDFYHKGEIHQAFSYYLKSIQTLEEYYGEAVTIDFEGKPILLINECFNRLHHILAHTGIYPEKSSFKLKKGTFKEVVASFSVLYKNPETQEILPFGRLPLILSFKNGKGQLSKDLQTNPQGKALLSIYSFDSEQYRNTVSIEMNSMAFAQGEKLSPFTERLLEFFPTVQSEIHFELTSPNIFLEAKETNLGKSMEVKPVTLAIKNALSAKGFVFTDKRNSADLLLKIEANTRKAGNKADFQTSYLDIDLKLVELKEGLTIYNKSLRDIKGVHLSYDEAGMVAYRKSTDVLKKELIPSLLRKLNP